MGSSGKRWWSAWVVAGALALASAAQAAVVLPQTPEALARQASTVVRGTVVSQQEGFDAAVHRSVVRTEIRVAERWKGEAPATVVVQQLGKLVRGRVAGIPGDATFRVGEDVVVFLNAGSGAEAGAWFLLGMGQGKFSVTPDARGPVATPETGTLSFPRAADRKNVAIPRALAELRSLVLRASYAPVPTAPATKAVRP